MYGSKASQALGLKNKGSLYFSIKNKEALSEPKEINSPEDFQDYISELITNVNQDMKLSEKKDPAIAILLNNILVYLDESLEEKGLSIEDISTKDPLLQQLLKVDEFDSLWSDAVDTAYAGYEHYAQTYGTTGQISQNVVSTIDMLRAQSSRLKIDDTTKLEIDHKVASTRTPPDRRPRPKSGP